MGELSGRVVSIQGVAVPLEYVRCRAYRHIIDDDHGALFQERNDLGRTVWVFRGECPRCGTRRITTHMPRSFQVISQKYEHPDGYDGLLSPAEARRILFKEKLARARGAA